MYLIWERVQSHRVAHCCRLTVRQDRAYISILTLGQGVNIRMSAVVVVLCVALC
jgi:hypothetical protein